MFGKSSFGSGGFGQQQQQPANTGFGQQAAPQQTGFGGTVFDNFFFFDSSLSDSFLSFQLRLRSYSQYNFSLRSTRSTSFGFWRRPQCTCNR